MTLWPTPNEHFKNLPDVEKFLKQSFTEINDRIDMLEKGIVSDDNGVTYEWVREHIDEKLLALTTMLEKLEERVKELEDNV